MPASIGSEACSFRNRQVFSPHGHRIAAPAPGITFLSQHKEKKDSVSYVCPFHEANKGLPGTFLFPLVFHLPE